MKRISTAAAVFALALSTLDFQSSILHAQGTAFTYQGRLNTNGAAATGSYDLAFTLYTTNLNGTPIAGPVTNKAVAVASGLFTTLVNFDNAFTGTSNWLQIAVSTNAANAFFTLTPRQQLTPVPYAIYAGTASNVSGTITAAQLPASVVTNDASDLTLTGTFSGNGAGLTNLNANVSNISNTATNPLSVVNVNAATNAVPTYDVDNPARSPVNASVSLTISSGANESEVDTSYTVPTGKRLVVECVSAYMNTADTVTNTVVYISGISGGTQFVSGYNFNSLQTPYPTTGTQLVKFYADAGTTITTDAYRLGTAGTEALTVSWSGHLIVTNLP